MAVPATVPGTAKPGGVASKTLPAEASTSRESTAAQESASGSRDRASFPAISQRSHLVRLLRQTPPSAWIAIDLLLVGAAIALAYHAFIFNVPAYQWVVSPWLSGVAFGICVPLAGMIFGLYERQTFYARSRIFVRSALTMVLGTTLAYALIYVAFYSVSSRWIGVWVIGLHMLVATPLRIALHTLICDARLNTLCIGTADSIRRLVGLIQGGQRGHYTIVGQLVTDACGPRDGAHDAPPESRFFEDDPRQERHDDPLADCPQLGRIRDVDVVLQEHAIDCVIIDPALASDPQIDAAVMTCLRNGCRVTDQATFTESVLGEVPPEAINIEWFLRADVTKSSSFDLGKRALDIAAASVGLMLTLPLWPLIMLAIRLDSPGGALFAQTRVGRNGRHFTIYKFRTMVSDAERNGAMWAVKRDTRITRLGQFLRRTRIDEIPQFWNILRGDMSLVGPRPERPVFVDQLSDEVPHYKQRHLILPGLTGWAQINYRYGASVADAHRKLCYDLYYLKHRSLDLDFAIIIRTLGTFLLGSR